MTNTLLRARRQFSPASTLLFRGAVIAVFAIAAVLARTVFEGMGNWRLPLGLAVGSTVMAGLWLAFLAWWPHTPGRHSRPR